MAAIAWARAKLFNGIANSIITLVAAFLALEIASHLIGWLFIRGVFSGGLDACNAAEGQGACWPFIGNWWRFVLFGRFPYEEQARPACACVIFIGLLAASCWRRLWWTKLLVLWVVGFIAIGILMFGGVLGLSYVSTENWGGLPLTIVIAAASLIGAFPLGILLALAKRSNLPILRALSIVDIELIRGVPLISVLFMASVMIPLLFPIGFSVNKLLRAIIGFTLFEAAYMADAVRAGLQAVPKGQFEAADALGLGYWTKMRRIILPQALRVVIPPMVNISISTFKDTSLVAIMSLFDLLSTTKVAINDPLWRKFYVEAYLFAAIVYFVFCFFMSKYSQFIERDLRRNSGR
jgi:general L-amino acid transport system permease protein